MSTNRPPYIMTFSGINGAGQVTPNVGALQSIQVGDLIAGVVNITTPGTATNQYEPVISTAGSIKQIATGNNSSQTYWALGIPQGWQSIQN